MRSRLVEAADATDIAEQMLRRAGAEAIARQPLSTRQQTEIAMRHDHVQKAGLGTHRAVTGEQPHRAGHIRLKADRAAMAAALHGRAMPVGVEFQ